MLLLLLDSYVSVNTVPAMLGVLNASSIRNKCALLVNIVSSTFSSLLRPMFV